MCIRDRLFSSGAWIDGFSSDIIFLPFAYQYWLLQFAARCSSLSTEALSTGDITVRKQQKTALRRSVGIIQKVIHFMHKVIPSIPVDLSLIHI